MDHNIASGGATTAVRSLGQTIDAIFEEFATFNGLTDGIEERLADRAERYGQPDAAFQGVLDWRLLAKLLTAELARGEWTMFEIGLLAAALQGVTPSHMEAVSPFGPPMIYEGICDWLDDNDDEVDDHDAATSALLERLMTLSPTLEHALTDAVSRWWTQGCDHSAEGWAKVGIRVIEPTGPAL